MRDIAERHRSRALREILLRCRRGQAARHELTLWAPVIVCHVNALPACQTRVGNDRGICPGMTHSSSSRRLLSPGRRAC
ncbi:protein of unknown function (plasmid) [Candidatus Methylocalor cossyra]|uniref:Uncharacterized protein n=1 Tax=Candidatus Methylocalor cossyra TaxID=3108543 RepID=A0ABM9NN17_9GAMM